MRAAATGSSNRIVRALVLADPPSVKHAEITAKGSLNINAILRHRKAWLDRLYTDSDPDIINVNTPK
jgi:feruloyl-CoA synthase